MFQEDGGDEGTAYTELCIAEVYVMILSSMTGEGIKLQNASYFMLRTADNGDLGRSFFWVLGGLLNNHFQNENWGEEHKYIALLILLYIIDFAYNLSISHKREIM